MHQSRLASKQPGYTVRVVSPWYGVDYRAVIVEIHDAGAAATVRDEQGRTIRQPAFRFAEVC